MTTTWTIAVDWDRNSNFTDTNDDITGRILEARWVQGMRRAYQDAADDSVLDLTLNNFDGRFSPENSLSPLYGKLEPFKRVRIVSHDGTTERTMWTGFIESIQPGVGQYGERKVQIVAAGQMQFLGAAESNLEIQENVRADEVILPLVQQHVPPPSVGAVWRVGVPNYSELGNTTYLANTSDFFIMGTDNQAKDKGITIFTMVADNWVSGGSREGQAFNAYGAIIDMVAGERGRFFFNREGKAVFWNRHHLLRDTASAATFDNTMQNLAYEYGSPTDFHNETVIVCHPRSISATSDEVLWELEGEVSVPANSVRSFTARYEDGSGNRIAGRNVRLDGVTFEGSAGAGITTQANSATITITNTGSTEARLTACRLLGEKITDVGLIEATASDISSIGNYGRRTLRKNLRALSDFKDAESIASYELNRRKTMRGVVRTMTLRSHGIEGGGHHANQLDLTIGDRITITEDQVSHSGDYHIIGEEHRLTGGATLFETTWYLEPVNLIKYWVLGQSKLGTETVLAY